MEKTGKTGFLKFLKDEKFIEWKLFPTDESIAYWEDFLQKNPHAKEDIALAENHFQHLKLSSYRLSQEKKAEAIKKLEQSVEMYHHRRKIRRFIYAAAACAAIFILSIIFLQPNRDHFVNDIASTGYIIGNELESEDILLITNNQTASFTENIDIEINNNGVAQIKNEDSGHKDIAIDERALNKLIIPYGKRSALTLSDGSKVWLNSGTILEFPAKFSDTSREIYLLSGEIYVEAAPDKQKSFYVHTSDFNVKVYGTKFNISSYANSPHSVILVEGSVSLQHSNSNEIYLSPHEQAVFSGNGTFQMQKVDVNQYISWKNGYLLFDDTPMTDVLRQIERYYNLSFDYDKNITLRNLTCTGKIILSEDLDNVMGTIALLTNTGYKKENNRIYITYEPH